MRNRCLIVFFLIILCSAMFAQSSQDEAAIMNILESETMDFTKMSISDLIKKYWITDDKTIMSVTFPDGNHISSKLEDLKEDTSVPPDGHAVAVKSDWKFSIHGDAAFVSFSQVVTMKEGNKLYSHEFRFLERVAGTWKIHVSSVHQYIPKGEE